MAKVTSSQAWLWHCHLSHLNFDTINLLSKNNIVNGLPKLKFVKDHMCSSCELGKAKRNSFHTKTTPSSKRQLQLLHMDLCGLMRVESINGKKFVLVIVDDYSRYTWTYFFRSKEETLEVLIEFLRLTKGIEHQTSTARTPKQNGVVERRNCTLVEAARTMLSAAKVPLFFWAEAIATACNTRNRSLVIPRLEKIPYHIINGQKPSVKFFHIFGSLCYIVRDGENLDKMKEKGDACIFVGYSTQSRAYRMASDYVSSEPIPKCLTTALKHDSLSPGPQSLENVPQIAETVTTSNELDLLFSLMFDELLNGTTQVVSKSSDVTTTDAPNQYQQHTTPSTSTTVAVDTPPLNIQTIPHIFGSLCHIVRDGENLDKMKEKDGVRSPKIITTSNELDLLFSSMFDELLNGTTQVESKSSAVTTDDAPNQCQQHTTPSTSITVAADTPPLNIQTTPETTSQSPTVTAIENINQAETNKENAQVEEDKFINIFSTPVQEQGETSSHHVDSLNKHTFYQRHPSEHHWTKDHPLEQVIRNPSQSIRTRRQLETDGEICMFALIVSRTEPKNIKEAMADSAWIKAMQEELHQFNRLDVWELVDKPFCKNIINLKWI
ncbi:retrovirus-related pol polyprotein from transposon TNT 1-94 [Tanacetum coccineum]